MYHATPLLSESFDVLHADLKDFDADMFLSLSRSHTIYRHPCLRIIEASSRSLRSADMPQARFYYGRETSFRRNEDKKYGCSPCLRYTCAPSTVHRNRWTEPVMMHPRYPRIGCHASVDALRAYVTQPSCFPMYSACQQAQPITARSVCHLFVFVSVSETSMPHLL